MLFTGGMANSEYVIKEISQYIEYITPILCFPGNMRWNL